MQRSKLQRDGLNIGMSCAAKRRCRRRGAAGNAALPGTRLCSGKLIWEEVHMGGGGVGGVAAWLQLCDSDGQWVTARTTALPLYVPDGRWACKSMFVAELKPGDE